jgi:hypothetical protein
MVAAADHQKRVAKEVLEKIAKMNEEWEHADRAQQEQEAAMRPPAGNTLTRREWWCCAALSCAG